jgi:RND family efflux transporter MFP subunit
LNDIDKTDAPHEVPAPVGSAPPPPADPPPYLKKAGRIGLIVAIAAAVGGVGLRWLHDRQVTQWTNAQAVPVVAVISPKRGVQGQQTVLPGNIQAWYEAPIYARVNGYLKNWYSDFGAHVKKGQLLAEIDAPDLDAELAAAQATLQAAESQIKVRAAEREFARTTYERWRDSPKGVVSVQEQESKKADFNSASARYSTALAEVASDKGVVDRLQALESYKRIVAPFDGTVTARNTDIGALINAGSGTGSGSAPVLFRVADVHQMRVFVQVPQEMSAGIHEGLTAELHLPQYPDRVFKALIATTSGSINESSRTLLVELHADNADRQLQPGTYAEVRFDLPGNPTMVRIPTSALIFRQEGMQVAVVAADDRVELRPIKLGRNLGTDVEVLTGITASDRVVDSPPDSLSSGEEVRVAPSGGEAAGAAPGSGAAAASAGSE